MFTPCNSESGDTQMQSPKAGILYSALYSFPKKICLRQRQHSTFWNSFILLSTIKELSQMIWKCYFLHFDRLDIRYRAFLLDSKADQKCSVINIGMHVLNIIFDAFLFIFHYSFKKFLLLRQLWGLNENKHIE